MIKKFFGLNRHIPLAVLSAIIILSIILRIYRLSSESLSLDEIAGVNVAKKNIEGILLHKDIHPPLYYIILHFWIELFGDTDFSIRFPSVIFGVASVYVIYKLGKLIFDDKVGILVAFILSISIFHIVYSQTERFYSLLTLLVLLSNYYFIKMLVEPKIKNNVRYIISTSMMLYTHGFGLFYIIVQNIYYILFKKNIRYWFMIQGIILLIFVPWINWMIKRLTILGVGGGGIGWIPSTVFFDIYNLFKYYAGIKYDFKTYSDIGLYLFIFVCIVDLYFFQKNEDDNRYGVFKYKRIFLFLWLLFPIMASFAISVVFAPIFVDRYLIGSLPAFLLLISKGIYNIRRYSIIMMLATLMILVLPAIFEIELYYSSSDQEQWRDVASYIEINKKNDDIILLYSSGIKGPFGYYYKNGSNMPILDKISHSGFRSVKINVPGSINSKSGNIRSDLIKVEPLKNYTFSGWGKTQNVGGKNVPALRIVELNNEKKTIKTNNLIFNSKINNWKQKNKTFQTNVNTKWVYVQANIWDGYGIFWIDDTSLVSESDSQNLIQNPGFEGMDNWNFTKRDIYFGLNSAKDVEYIIKEYGSAWLIISHVWSPQMKNESKSIREALSRKYVNQSKVKFKGMELIYYSE